MDETQRPFGLMEMVAEELPKPAVSNQKTLDRRSFLTAMSVAAVAAPNLLAQAAPVPAAMAASLPNLPQNHPLVLITNFARARSKLSNFWVEIGKQACREKFTETEDPTRRSLLAIAKEGEKRSLYASHAETKRQMYENREAIVNYAAEHPDTIRNAFPYEHETFFERFKTPEGLAVEIVKPKNETSEILEHLGYYAEYIQKMRNLSGVYDPSVNPFEAVQPEIKKMQGLIDGYSHHRYQAYAQVNEFKRFIWAQKKLFPLEETLDVQKAMNASIEQTSVHYDEAMRLANEITSKKEWYSLLKNDVGLVRFDWKYHNNLHNTFWELLDLAGNKAPEVMAALAQERDNLTTQYEAAAKDTLLRWELVRILKDPLTHINSSSSMFKITRKDSGEVSDGRHEAKQATLDELNKIITTLYPEKKTATAKAMLFIERGNPQKRRQGDELSEALEAIMHQSKTSEQAIG